MGTGRVAPASIVVREGVVRGAEVGGRHQDRRAARVAPLAVVHALDLEASPAAEPIVEQRRAQGCCVHSVSLAVQVPVPTGPACTKSQIFSPVQPDQLPGASNCSAYRDRKTIFSNNDILDNTDSGDSEVRGRNVLHICTYPWFQRRRHRRRRWRGRSASDRPDSSPGFYLQPHTLATEGTMRCAGLPRRPSLARVGGRERIHRRRRVVARAEDEELRAGTGGYLTKRGRDRKGIAGSFFLRLSIYLFFLIRHSRNCLFLFFSFLFFLILFIYLVLINLIIS